MIIRLNYKYTLDVLDFIATVPDRYEEFFITKDKQRLFLKNKKIILNILKHQEVYGLFEGQLKGLMMILREKNYRPYVKFLSINNAYNRDLLKYFLWNFMGSEIFCKLKKRNPLVEILKKKVFIQIGDRGQEVLLLKKAIKDIRPFVGKDEYINYEEMYEKHKK